MHNEEGTIVNNVFLFGKARGNKTYFLTCTACLVALTVACQWLCSLAGIQLLTGSVVNMFLIFSASLVGLVGAGTVGIITPFIALALGINPNVVLVPFIALSNAIIIAVYCLSFLFKQDAPWQGYLFKGVGVVLGATLKFVFMYFVCVKLVLPLFVESGVLPQPALKNLATAWGIIQQWAALIGGAFAVLLETLLSHKKIRLIPNN